MPATTQDRATAYRDGKLFVIPVAQGAVIPAGTMVCVNASGFAVPGAATAALAYMGCADERADNTSGTDGAVSIPVQRGKAFCWASDASDPVTQASVGRDCYVSDNQTVAKTSNANARPRAGVVIGVDADGVWVL